MLSRSCKCASSGILAKAKLARLLIRVLISWMALPYRIATLLYCFNPLEEVLLLERMISVPPGVSATVCVDGDEMVSVFEA